MRCKCFSKRCLRIYANLCRFFWSGVKLNGGVSNFFKLRSELRFFISQLRVVQKYNNLTTPLLPQERYQAKNIAYIKRAAFPFEIVNTHNLIADGKEPNLIHDCRIVSHCRANK